MSSAIKKKPNPNPTTTMIPLSPLLTESFVLTEERFPGLFKWLPHNQRKSLRFCDTFPPGIPLTENSCLQCKELTPVGFFPLVSPCNFTSYNSVKTEAHWAATVLSQGEKEPEKGRETLLLNLPKENWDPLEKIFTPLDAVCTALVVSKSLWETNSWTRSEPSK